MDKYVHPFFGANFNLLLLLFYHLLILQNILEILLMVNFIYLRKGLILFFDFIRLTLVSNALLDFPFFYGVESHCFLSDDIFLI